MIQKLKIEIKISKGSPLTGNAWVDVLLGGEKVIDKQEITAPFKPISEVEPNVFTVETDYNGVSNLALTVINNAQSIGPIQTYDIHFYLDDKEVSLNWQQAIKGKPLRFGGQPNVTIFNPHLHSEDFSGWASVTDISPGMSITWGLADLVNTTENL